MEITGLIGICAIAGITTFYLIELRKLRQREREWLLRVKRSREMMKRMEQAEGKIKWN